MRVFQQTVQSCRQGHHNEYWASAPEVDARPASKGHLMRRRGWPRLLIVGMSPHRRCPVLSRRLRRVRVGDVGCEFSDYAAGVRNEISVQPSFTEPGAFHSSNSVISTTRTK